VIYQKSQNQAVNCKKTNCEAGFILLLRDNIYESVRAEILACRLAPGEEMREQILAARYSVSRAPVREALMRLEKERLVTVTPRQGYRVNPISLSDAADLFELRSVLEPACAAAAASRASADILRKLDAFRRLSPRRDFIEYNRAFHAAVAYAGGNQRMAETVCQLIDQAERLVRVRLDSIQGRDTSQLVAEHAAIIDAIQDRDARRAARIVRDHVRRAGRRILASLGQSAVVS
jgi:DNA-binding GntR family transcriptional regulator